MPDMFMNFMFYTNDECMGMFTLGQKTRMLATLNTARQGLLDYVPIIEIDEKQFLKILKNPADASLIFEIGGQPLNAGQVFLTNLNGAVVVEQEIKHTGQHSLEIMDLPGGVYFLIFENKGTMVARKVIIF